MYQTDFNAIIEFCISNKIEFEINKRFVNDPTIECVFNINMDFGEALHDNKRLTYKVVSTDDETSKILGVLNAYLNLNPMSASL